MADESKTVSETTKTDEEHDCQSECSDWSSESELSFSDCVYPDELEELQRQVDEECVAAMESTEKVADVVDEKKKSEEKDVAKPSEDSPSTAPPARVRRGDDSDDEELPEYCSMPCPQVFYGPYRIFFDVEVDGCFVGRVIIKLGNQFPDCRNHIDKLCTGTMPPHNGMTMHYTGTRIHRMEPGMYVEGGILRPLIPESYDVMHVNDNFVINPQFYDSYIMVANKDIDDECGGARFFITTTNAVKHCYPEHVPIGCVVCGMGVIDYLATLPRDDKDYFTNTVTIGHCGSIHMFEDAVVGKGRCEKPNRLLSTFFMKMQKKRPQKRMLILHQYSPYRLELEKEKAEAEAREQLEGPSEMPTTSTSDCQ